MKVIQAIVYVIDVEPGEHDPQVETFERMSSAWTTPPGTELLFATGVLACEAKDYENPDFDVTVRSHDRTLEPVPYQE